MADIQEAIAQEIRFMEADRKQLETEISDLTNRVEVLILKRIAGIPWSRKARVTKRELENAQSELKTLNEHIEKLQKLSMSLEDPEFKKGVRGKIDSEL